MILAGISLLASGLWWQWGLLAHELPTEGDHWLARWHALSSVVGLFALGVVSTRHISRGWELRARHWSGVSLTVAFVLLALSGYALAYFVPEIWHTKFGISHTVFGILAFACGALHRR